MYTPLESVLFFSTNFYEKHLYSRNSTGFLKPIKKSVEMMLIEKLFPAVVLFYIFCYFFSITFTS